MSYKAKVVEVMIATPGDVSKERQLAGIVLWEWNNIYSKDKDLVLMPVGWESHAAPEMGDRPQAVINKQVLKNCDLLIAVFWTRLGSPTGKFASGTVEEIEEHLKAGKPAMIYFSSVPAALGEVDQKQYKALLKFKEECRQRGLIAEYDSLPDFKDKLARQLAQTVLRHFSKKNGVPSEDDVALPKRTRIPDLSAHARILLQEAVQDDNGIVLCIRGALGLVVQTHGVNLASNYDPRDVARWEGALRQLREHSLVEPRDSRGDVFSVTDEGYRVADLLPIEPMPVA